MFLLFFNQVKVSTAVLAAKTLDKTFTYSYQRTRDSFTFDNIGAILYNMATFTFRTLTWPYLW